MAHRWRLEIVLMTVAPVFVRRLFGRGVGKPSGDLTFGQRVADGLASLIGSWRFIIAQTAILAAWVALNAFGIARFDIYPFILLNLFLSFQAAYATPILLMSQNRQAEIDRQTLQEDLAIDKAEEASLRGVNARLDLITDVLAELLLRSPPRALPAEPKAARKKAPKK